MVKEAKAPETKENSGAGQIAISVYTFIMEILIIADTPHESQRKEIQKTFLTSYKSSQLDEITGGTL